MGASRPGLRTTASAVTLKAPSSWRRRLVGEGVSQKSVMVEGNMSGAFCVPRSGAGRRPHVVSRDASLRRWRRRRVNGRWMEAGSAAVGGGRKHLTRVIGRSVTVRPRLWYRLSAPVRPSASTSTPSTLWSGPSAQHVVEAWCGPVLVPACPPYAAGGDATERAAVQRSFRDGLRGGAHPRLHGDAVEGTGGLADVVTISLRGVVRVLCVSADVPGRCGGRRAGDQSRMAIWGIGRGAS